MGAHECVRVCARCVALSMWHVWECACSGESRCILCVVMLNEEGVSYGYMRVRL